MRCAAGAMLGVHCGNCGGAPRCDAYAKMREDKSLIDILSKAGKSLLRAVYVGEGKVVCPNAIIGPVREMAAALTVPLPLPKEIIEAKPKHGYNANTVPDERGTAGSICDGCNVREPWEHRCHEGPPIMIYGETYDVKCECPECNHDPGPLCKQCGNPAKWEVVCCDPDGRNETREPVCEKHKPPSSPAYGVYKL